MAKISEIAPSLSKTVCREAFDALPEDEQEWLRREMMTAHALLAKELPSEALAYINSLNLDVETMVACWSLFDSKQRSAMKRK